MLEIGGDAVPELTAPERAEVLRCARLAFDAIQREYPYHLAHVVNADDEARPPREIHPVFGTAFDWHSSVHGHWCVIRAARTAGDAGFARDVEALIERRFAPERLAAEHAYLEAPGHEGFERPYGLAWVLTLAAELAEWDAAPARRWRERLMPLERLAAERLAAWLARLPGPVRGGEHSQTAFAMGLALDHARVTGDRAAAFAIVREARRFYLADHAAPVATEPSAHDFLSPALGEADLMRRVLDPSEFQSWIGHFTPERAAAVDHWLEPVRSPDPSDGKLSHLCGLNLSRAWMLEGITSALDAPSPLRSHLADAAVRHRVAGLAAVTAEHYAGSHWLGSFAVYLLTRRGLAPPRA